MSVAARLSVNINDDTATRLQAMCDTQGITVTEAVRRCVAVHWLFVDAQARGLEIRFVDHERNETTTVVLRQ